MSTKHAKIALDNSAPFIKRYKALLKYLDSIKDNKGDLDNFYNKNYISIFNIFKQSLNHFDSQAKSKKGNKSISVSDTLSLLKILIGFPKHCGEKLVDGWKRKEFIDIIEVFCEHKVHFQIRLKNYRLLVLLVDVLQENCEKKLIDLVSQGLNYRVVSGTKVSLPSYDKIKPTMKLRIQKSGSDKKEDAIQFFDVLVNIMKESQSFIWWWTYLKDNVIRILWPKECSMIMKSKNLKEYGFLNSKCPSNVYLKIFQLLTYCFQYKFRRDVFYKNDENCELVLMMFEKAFESLRPKNFKTIREVMDIYEKWICKDDDKNFKWEGVLEENSEKYFRIILRSACNLVSFHDDETSLDHHVEASYILTRIIRTFSKKSDASDKFKMFVLSKVIDVSTVCLNNYKNGKKFDKEYAKIVERNFVREVFIYFITIHPDIYQFTEHWDQLGDFVQTFMAIGESVFDFWSSTLLNLTNSVILNVFKLPPQFVGHYQKYKVNEHKYTFNKKRTKRTKKEVKEDIWETPLDLFDNEQSSDIILQLFHRFLSFYGNQSSKLHVDLHCKKIKVIREVVKLFLNISNFVVKVKKGGSVPHSPEGNRLLELFVNPLLEACYRDDDGFQYGKLDAFVTLCYIFCHSKYYVVRFKVENLAKFYTVIHRELSSGKNKAIVDAVITHSWNIFCYNFKGSHILIPSFMKACFTVINRSMALEELNLCAHACLNSLIPILYFYGDLVIPSIEGKKKYSFKELRTELLKFYEEESKTTQKFPNVETNVLWGLYFILIYEIEISDDNVKHIIQLIMNSLLSSKNEVWITAHDIITSLAQSKIIRKINAETIRLIIRDICFKVLSLKIKGFENPKAIVSLIYTLLEVIIEIPFNFFIENKEFSTLIFKMIAFARETSIQEVKTASNVLLSFTLNFLNNFPLLSGSSVVSSHMSEFNYLVENTNKTYEPDPVIQHYVFNKEILYTIVDIKDEEAFYLIVRDVTGKYAWKIKSVYVENQSLYMKKMRGAQNIKSIRMDKKFSKKPAPRAPQLKKNRKTISINDDNKSGGVKQKMTGGNTGTRAAPKYDEKIDTNKVDMLEKYLNFMKKDFPDTIKYSENVVTSIEQQKLINRKVIEQIQQQQKSEEIQTKSKKVIFCGIKKPKKILSPDYHFGRNFLSNMGLFTPEFRSQFVRLNNNHKFYRRLKHLDEKMIERETIKIGIIYVKNGQEDESSILQNEVGSPLFNEFLQGLGWEIDLTKHKGFFGGLDKRGGTGKTTHYYSNATTEVIFHISTYIPTKENDLVQIKKKKHIGNDWVHIVWSEHDRDYRSWTISTQFNYAHIIIYPLMDPLFRIEVSKKAGVPLIGPLQTNMIVEKRHLCSLVKMTAINANKVVRYSQPGYKKCYLTRRNAIKEIVNEYSIKNDSYEGFYKSALCKPMGDVKKSNVAPKKKIKPQSFSSQSQPPRSIGGVNDNDNQNNSQDNNVTPGAPENIPKRTITPKSHVRTHNSFNKTKPKHKTITGSEGKKYSKGAKQLEKKEMKPIKMGLPPKMKKNEKKTPKKSKDKPKKDKPKKKKFGLFSLKKKKKDKK